MYGIEQLEFWHWLSFAAVLVILEVLLPGTFFLWIGVSAAIVGVVTWAVPALPWQIQALIFAGLSIVIVFAYRTYLRKYPIESDEPTLNRRGARFIGRVFTLDAPLVNGVGKVRADGSQWKVAGSDLPAGTRVRVVAVNGTVLQVEPLEVQDP